MRCIACTVFEVRLSMHVAVVLRRTSHTAHGPKRRSINYIKEPHAQLVKLLSLTFLRDSPANIIHQKAASRSNRPKMATSATDTSARPLTITSTIKGGYSALTSSQEEYTVTASKMVSPLARHAERLYLRCTVVSISTNWER